VLNGPVTHPYLLRALAAAGHGSRILIADGNYPVATASNPGADTVFLNLARGVVDAATVLESVSRVLPVESAAVMAAELPTPGDPPIWATFAEILADAGHQVGKLERIGRHDFYARARSADTSAVIATGEAAVYGNLLLTVGVRA